MKEIKRYVFLSPLVVIALVALTACMPQFAAAKAAAPTATALPTPAQAPAAQAPAGDALAALEGRLEQIYDQVSPSVVNIQVVQTVDVVLGLSPIPGFPFMPSAPQTPQKRGGLGSGFVWDKAGAYRDQQPRRGRCRQDHGGLCRRHQCTGHSCGHGSGQRPGGGPGRRAADRLQPVAVADSTQVKVGQLAVAIGNPFGLQGTMTVGFVSALGRYLPVESDSQGSSYTIPDIIQTDAPINPGNSGGVLVNDQGQVVGVTAAIESPVRANAGIGFAIPSVIVQKVVPALIEQGHYDHPWLGISGLALLPELERRDETGSRSARHPGRRRDVGQPGGQSRPAWQRSPGRDRWTAGARGRRRDRRHRRPAGQGL